MTMEDMVGYDEPCFVISVAARIVGVRTQTLRYYESIGLVEPRRTSATSECTRAAKSSASSGFAA